MLHFQAWHLGLILQTLGVGGMGSLASADPSAGIRRGGEWKRRVEKCSRKLGLRPPALLMNVLCMSLGNWHRACISKKTLRVSAVELGGHKALQMVYNSVGRALRKTRVWCLLVPMLAQHPSSGAGGACVYNPGAHTAQGRGSCADVPHQACTKQAWKGH